ncbi:hypothetical protein [Chamaesiphon sp. VAR_69_metabat_338]|uniref:hypothetical protein n=1 Tax=Chamaesiphon sp. VAR_69_metabat_338 TaxID=2964704 RepID=UPI00286E21E8|nr:hypothetical protein [Chamaesiphon sp. VAR_69_metabat_338]
MVVRYRRHSIERKLAPSTINVRLAAIKSLLDMARKLGKTTIDLSDIVSYALDEWLNFHPRNLPGQPPIYSIETCHWQFKAWR